MAVRTPTRDSSKTSLCFTRRIRRAMGARRAISFDKPNYEEAKKMDAWKLRERREQRLGYEVASPRASNSRADKTSKDRLDHVKRERAR